MTKKKEKVVIFGVGKHWNLVKQGCISENMDVVAYMDNNISDVCVCGGGYTVLNNGRN